MSRPLMEWSYVPLQEVVGKITSGGTPKAGASDYYGGNIPFLKINDLTNSSRFIDSSSLNITEKGLENSSAKIFPVGTVLTTMYGTIGVTRILRKPMATNQAIAAFLDLRGVTPEFLMQLINFEAGKLASMASQTTQANISATVLKEYLVDIPPLPEQKKIASILTSVDEVIENTQQQIDKLQDLKKATMNELLTKGIGHTEFKDSELGRIPKSWEVVNFQELIHSSNQGVNTTTEKVTYSDNGTKACRSNNIQENYFDWSDEKFVDQDTYARLSEKVKPQMNDVLYCNIGSNLGASTVVMVSEPFMVTWNVLRITPNHRVIMPHFLCYSLNSARQKLRDFATESTMPFISSKALSKFKFRIPPISEQEKISIAIDTIYSLIEFQKQKLSQTQSLKKSLMQDLLTGKVRVTVN